MERDKALSPAVCRALTIIRDHPGVAPAAFAKLMWPDAEGHRRPTKCGRSGSHRGGGMVLAAGGFLGRLVKAGLVCRGSWLSPSPNSFYLTQGGASRLKEAL